MNKQNCIPKLIGGDVELANFIVGLNQSSRKSDYEASRLLLDEVKGLPNRWFHSCGYAIDNLASATVNEIDPGNLAIHDGSRSQDSGRRYLYSNGGCIYIDLNHLELATPEVLSARDYQAVWMAMLRIARQAQEKANEGLPNGRHIVVLANNSDRQGNSYGGHQNFLMSRRAWDEMIRQRMIPGLFYLMAFQASSIVFTGQGKVGSENGQPRVAFQISQRADFIETLLGEQTMEFRPLINSRDEALSGPKSQHGGKPLPGDQYARLHVIFYDTNLAPVATYLKVGVMQLILAMIEAGYVDANLLLEKPLLALHEWSRDPDLKTRMPLLSGQKLTAVELQLKFLEQVRAFDTEQGFAGIVEDAEQIIALWEDSLIKLKAGSFSELRGRIDWIMKRALLEQALAEHPKWDWNSPELTYLDQIYASIDPADSLFLSMDAAGLFEAVATEAEITHFVSNPPENTRAWTRAMLLRTTGPEQVVSVDWDRIELKSTDNDWRRTQVELPDPLGATKSLTRSAFADAVDFDSLLQGLQRVGVKSHTPAYPSTGAAVLLADDGRHRIFNQRK